MVILAAHPDRAAGAPMPRTISKDLRMRFCPSKEMLEAIQTVTGIDPLFEPEVILKALRDPATAPEIERLYDRLKAAPVMPRP
jgi:hypothetical protein